MIPYSHNYTRATVSRQIASSSFVGITATFTLESAAEITQLSPLFAFASASRELPPTAQKLPPPRKYDAVICAGAVIRGDTSHYDLVCSEAAKGIAQVGLASGVPVLFGVITTENIEQAIARAGSKAGNKGYDCALSAIEMVNLMNQL